MNKWVEFVQLTICLAIAPLAMVENSVIRDVITPVKTVENVVLFQMKTTLENQSAPSTIKLGWEFFLHFKLVF